MGKIINLDLGEEIDVIKLNGREYEIGDLPLLVLQKVNNVDTTGGLAVLLQEWRAIAKEILEIRNDAVNMDAVTDEKLTAFIKYILDKVKNQ